MATPLLTYFQSAHHVRFFPIAVISFGARSEPLRQRRIRLMAQPQPRHPKKRLPQPRIARFQPTLAAIGEHTLPRRQACKSLNLATVFEMAGQQAFAPQHRNRFGVDALEPQQPLHRRICRLCGNQRVALCLDRLDVLKHQFQSIQLTAHLVGHVLRQILSFIAAQSVKARAPICRERLIVQDPSRKKQSVDATDVAVAIPDQHAAFPA
ncbi:MAG: hypothetical protein FWD68_03980 [Alphaproteobacteria bacterium]|nr:hypothetical protein [Alphaproteobacteria bacterium]